MLPCEGVLCLIQAVLQQTLVFLPLEIIFHFPNQPNDLFARHDPTPRHHVMS